MVFRNLLSNAFEAVADLAEGQKQVRIFFLLEKPQQIGIGFEDSGSGLANSAHLFEAFHSTKTTGLGLGLVISRAIAEAHGGSLLAIQTDHGLFRLSLPIEQSNDDET